VPSWGEVTLGEKSPWGRSHLGGEGGLRVVRSGGVYQKPNGWVPVVRGIHRELYTR
jgi:hypothetical protein